MLKTLIILTPGFPKNEADSTCIPGIQTFMRALKRSQPGLNIIVIAFQYPFNAAEYQWNGIKVIAIAGKGKGGLWRRITWIKAWMILKQLNKQYQVIGLLSFWFGECSLVAHRFSKKYSLKHYSWLRGQDAKPGNKFVKLIKPTGEYLIALSDFIVKEFNKNYGVKPKHTITLGIDTGLFEPAAAIRDIDIIGAGSLIPLKQYSIFVDAINFLRKDFPHIKAVICGKGPEMELLQNKIKALNLENNLTLLGELPHTEVLKLMQRSKVFLHPSNYEGFGLVCLEALYAGTKVVSFASPMDEVITNWYKVKDEPEMYQLVGDILHHPDKYYNCIAPYLIYDTTKALIQLFDYNEPAIS